MINATTNTTNNIPDHTPALKIAPIASQLLRPKTIDKNNRYLFK